MDRALSESREQDIRGFHDIESDLTFIAINDIEDFMMEEVIPICESCDSLNASKFFIDFLRDCKKHFFNPTSKN